MKVLVLSHMYPSTFNNVYGIFVHEQVRELVKQGCEVKVVSPVPWSPFPVNRMSAKWKAYAKIPKQQMWEGIEVFYPRYLEFPRNYLQRFLGFLPPLNPLLPKEGTKGWLSLEAACGIMYLGIKTVVNNIYKKYKFDIIHAHVAYPDGYVGLKLKHTYKVPLVVTIHGIDVCSCAPQIPTIERGFHLKKMIVQIFEGANKVVGVSSKVRDIILKYYSHVDKVVFVNNGIPVRKITKNNLAQHSPTELTTPQSPPSQGGDKGVVKNHASPVPPSQGGDKGVVKNHVSPISPSQGGDKGVVKTCTKKKFLHSNTIKPENQKTKIISVGYLDIRKGHEYVIRSLVGLKNDGIDFEYTVVGDGENRGFLEKLSKDLKVEDRIKFTGIKNQDEVYASLRESDIFCLPSWDEAFGVAYIEAMSAGLPVIACKGQGIEDVITDGITGLLVKPKDTASVEDALKKLIKNPKLRQEIGLRAREHVLSRFTWSTNVKRYIEIYQEILGGLPRN